MANGLSVQLAIEDRLLAERIEAMLLDLDVELIEPDSDAASIAITDVLPHAETDQAVILLADDVDPLAALRVGVAGVLPKSAEMADLRIALAAASRGLAVAPLRMIESVRHDAAAPFDATGVTDSIGLTSRELEVLGLLSEGASNKEDRAKARHFGAHREISRGFDPGEARCDRPHRCGRACGTARAPDALT